MNKEQIIEAINQTIVQNNKKGITATSLRNVLTEMVQASADNGVAIPVVKLPDSIIFFVIFLEMGSFSLETISIVEEELSAESAEEQERIKELVAIWRGYIDHNKQVYETMMNLARQGVSTPALLDCSESGRIAVELLYNSLGGKTSMEVFVGSSLANTEVYEGIIDGEYKAGVVLFEITKGYGALFNGKNFLTDGGETVYMTLMSDGSVVFGMPIDDKVDKMLYLPVEGELSSEQMEVNRSFVDYYSSTAGISYNPSNIEVKVIKNGVQMMGQGITLLKTHTVANDAFYATYLDGNQLKQITISTEDGSTTITQIGSLNV